MYLFLTSPAAVGRAAATGVSPRLLLGLGLEGEPLPPAPLRHSTRLRGARAAGRRGRQTESLSWSSPFLRPRAPVEDTAAFSVLISVR